MSSTDTFKRMFSGVVLEVEDLFLLESFQVEYFPGWVPEVEFAVVLRENPALARFLVKKCPSVADCIERNLADHDSVDDQLDVAMCCDRLVWAIADLLVYNKCPEVYDALEFHGWDFREVTSIVNLEGKVVVDGGAGTGRVALEAARSAHHVFAVEPVGRMRRFIRERAYDIGLANVFIVDGFLHAIPLPDDSVDVLITSHALGWRLEEELREFERVVKGGGSIIHCPGTAENASGEELHSRLISSDWGYEFARYEEADGWKRKYWKRR